MCGARRHLRTESFHHLAARPEQQLGLYQGKAPVAGALDFYDFVPISRKTTGGQPVTIVFLYVTPGHGGTIVEKFKLLGAFHGMLSNP